MLALDIGCTRKQLRKIFMDGLIIKYTGEVEALLIGNEEDVNEIIKQCARKVHILQM